MEEGVERMKQLSNWKVKLSLDFNDVRLSHANYAYN